MKKHLDSSSLNVDSPLQGNGMQTVIATINITVE